MSARHTVPGKRDLTRNEIVDAAVKIIGEDRVQRANVEATVDRTRKLSEMTNRTRSSESKEQKRFAKQYSAALRKVITMTRKAPFHLRIQKGLPLSVPQLGIKEVFDHQHLLRHLEALNWICEAYEKSKLGKPKPSADEKRLAAEAALQLLKMHGIDPTTTKNGVLCALAAALYGDEKADLQHHCRGALSRARIRDKNHPGHAPAGG
jgi:hypothetical protein